MCRAVRFVLAGVCMHAYAGLSKKQGGAITPL